MEFRVYYGKITLFIFITYYIILNRELLNPPRLLLMPPHT